MSVDGAPEKFIKVNNVRKLNPAWKAWNNQQKQAQTASAGGQHNVQFTPSMANEATALPVVTSVQDQQRHLQGSAASESVEASVEMMQDEDIAASVGVSPENAMAGLNAVFSKYEVPMGLINKLMGVSDYQFMEMIIDDSGSMNQDTDTRLPNGHWMSRWQEVHSRLMQMFEVLVHIPFPPCYIRFLNRPDVVEINRKDGENPQALFMRVSQALAPVFQRPPAGTTPARERIAESLARCPGQSMLRYFFGDGQPNGGAMAARAITQMLITRPNPAQNPFTFMSCTNEDDAVEWMKEAEEAAPYCAEFDDYQDEQVEVLTDQGRAFPFSFGLWLVGSICAAFNPHDLDALDESAPMTKQTIDNLLGYQMSPQEYQYYFDNFLAAQSAKPVETAVDKLKKDYIPFWKQNFQHFLQAPMANQIEAVQAYQKALTELKLRGQ